MSVGIPQRFPWLCFQYVAERLLNLALPSQAAQNNFLAVSIKFWEREVIQMAKKRIKVRGGRKGQGNEIQEGKCRQKPYLDRFL